MDRSHSMRTNSSFRVDCNVDGEHRFRAEANSLWINIGQRVRRNNRVDLWESIAVEGKELPDGSLVIRVLVFNPDWDEPLQVAAIKSRPKDPDCLTPLGCNLDHVGL